VNSENSQQLLTTYTIETCFEIGRQLVENKILASKLSKPYTKQFRLQAYYIAYQRKGPVSKLTEPQKLQHLYRMARVLTALSIFGYRS